MTKTRTTGASTVEPCLTPVFIICRNLVSALSELVTWLEDRHFERLILVDNNSTFEPLLEYFERTPHQVIRLPQNMGPHASIWESGVRDELAGVGPFVVTDSDIVPDPGCPPDVIDYLEWALARYPKYIKAGLGLRIDDLPASYSHTERVIRWERQYWERRLQPGLYRANVDTTFALYRPGNDRFALGPAIRTGPPYVARHRPWYSDSANPTEEERYYRETSDRSKSQWTHPDDGVNAGRLPPERLSPAEQVRWRLHAAFKEERDSAIPSRYGRGSPWTI